MPHGRRGESGRHRLGSGGGKILQCVVRGAWCVVPPARLRPPQPAQQSKADLQPAQQAEADLLQALHARGVALPRHIARLQRQPDRLRSLAGRLLLHHALRCHGMVGDVPLVGVGPYGKPQLAGPGAPQFNLSHAGRWIVCALARGPVGIDVEQLRPIDLRLAERYFHRDEYAALLASAPGERLARFFRLWTAKEAYVKALGLGLQRELSSFAVLADRAGRLHLQDPLQGAQHFVLSELPLAAGYALTLCRPQAAAAPAPVVVPWQALLDGAGEAGTGSRAAW